LSRGWGGVVVTPRLPGIRGLARPVALALALALAGAACASDGDETPPPTLGATDGQSPASTPPGSTGSTPPPTSSVPGNDVIPTDAVEVARADLVDRFAYEPGQIAVERVEPTTWPNAGLGCPRTGQEYDPAPVPGYRIILGVGELDFAYHGAAGEPPSICQFLD